MSFPLKALALTSLLVAVSVQSSAQNPTLKSAMQAKIASTRGLFEAVVVSDFGAVARSADALSRISETEIVSWQSAAQTEYLKQASAFILSIRGLREASQKRDTEAVLSEYTSLVSACTRCHAYVRGRQTISFER